MQPLERRHLSTASHVIPAYLMMASPAIGRQESDLSNAYERAYSPQSSTAPVKEGIGSVDTDAGILTASESDCPTDDETSLETGSEEEWNERNGESEDEEVDIDIDDSVGTISPHKPLSKRAKRPPPIFFGTPSKAEHERRDKYNARLRTRRLLRKDSIELTRRKSGGWEGHEARTEVEKGVTEDDDELRSETFEDDKENANALDFDVPSESVLSSPGRQLEQVNVDDVEAAESSMPIAAERNQGHSQESAPAQAEPGVEDDPDATEEADWFGANSIPLGPASTSLTSSLPSTPTRQEVHFRPGSRIVRPSLAPSDADSSPGIALAVHPLAYRQSPLDHGYNRTWSTHTSPYSFSPALSRSALVSPQASRENPGQGPHVEVPRSSSSRQVLRESPRRSNRGGSDLTFPVATLSPTKSDVRKKLAAWAETKVKTPQSPEKREWELMRASTLALSPSIGKVNHVSSVLSVARQVPLPPSPGKIEQVKEAESSSKSRTATQSVPAGVLKNPSPTRQAAESRNSKGQAVSSTSRLPRPFKQSVAKPLNQVQSRSLSSSTPSTGSVGLEGRKVFAISSLQRSTPRTLNRGLPGSRLANSSSSMSSVSSSPRGGAIRSGSHHALSSSSSISSSPHQVFRNAAPIVRDARLIASRQMSPLKDEGIARSSDEIVPISQPAVEQQSDSDESGKPAPAVAPLSSSTGVGGARRIALGAQRRATRSTDVAGKSQNLTTHKPLGGKSSTAADFSVPSGQRRLGGQPEGSESVATAKMNKARPMRRINDFVRRVEPSVSSKRSGADEAQALAQKAVIGMDVKGTTNKLQGKEVFRAAPPVTLRRSLHTQGRTVAESTIVADDAVKAKAAAPTAALASTQRQTLSSSRSASATPRTLPLSSAELSRLTSLHTRCNETAVVELQLVVVRKEGEVRPPSPSSKFRKAASMTACHAGNKADRVAKEAQAREKRAAQRSARSSGGESCPSSPTKHIIDDDDDGHRMGAGDEEMYTSPVRRITLKKVVRWHRGLFVGPSDMGDEHEEGQRREDDHQPRSRTPSNRMRSCLARSGSTHVALDRLGNVPEAGKALHSPTARRQKVVVKKIVYDDEENEYDEGR